MSRVNKALVRHFKLQYKSDRCQVSSVSYHIIANSEDQN